MTYTEAIDIARNLYATVMLDDTDNEADPDELYLSGLSDLICKMYDVSVDTVLTAILA